MAGRPVTRTVIAGLTRHGEDHVFETYLGSKGVLDTLEKLGLPPMLRPFYTWLHETPDRWAKWLEVRRIIADRAAELVRTIPEDVEQSEDVPLARLRVDSAKWTAEQFDRALYGRQPTPVNVEVSVNSAWLVSLREGGAEAPTANSGVRGLVEVQAGGERLSSGDAQS